MRRVRLVLVALSFLVATALPALALKVVPVVATDDYEYHPAASANYVAWSVSVRGHNDLYAEKFGRKPFKVNARGTEGINGGIDGTTLIYQQFGGGSGSDIYFFDLRTKDRTKAPRSINTDRWEYWPSLSGDWLLFFRLFNDGSRETILFNLATGETRTLDETRGSRHTLGPGQVNGNFVVWEEDTYAGGGTFTACDIIVYDISNENSTTVPNPNAKCQYGPSVDPSGTVYYGRSGFSCGANATVNKYPIGGEPKQLLSLDRGVDFVTTYAVDNADGTVDVYFDEGSCKPSTSDIVKITAS